ncbi:MAG: nicotinate-nucleotide adenylyltransferase, partial [Armatimonadota bacterium]|nr:nicotinate-nucleotide adenylyltransferase [Armatimonadota bacterium]
ELDRPGPSFAIDTVRQFRANLGPHAEVHFLTGIDAVMEILTWRDPEALIRECHFIAAARPGYDVSQLSSRLPPHFLSSITILEAPEVGVSSSDIRQRLRDGRSVTYLVPESVEAYIRKNRLYVG